MILTMVMAMVACFGVGCKNVEMTSSEVSTMVGSVSWTAGYGIASTASNKWTDAQVVAATQIATVVGDFSTVLEQIGSGSNIVNALTTPVDGTSILDKYLDERLADVELRSVTKTLILGVIGSAEAYLRSYPEYQEQQTIWTGIVGNALTNAATGFKKGLREVIAEKELELTLTERGRIE